MRRVVWPALLPPSLHSLPCAHLQLPTDLLQPGHANPHGLAERKWRDRVMMQGRQNADRYLTKRILARAKAELNRNDYQPPSTQGASHTAGNLYLSTKAHKSGLAVDADCGRSRTARSGKLRDMSCKATNVTISHTCMKSERLPIGRHLATGHLQNPWRPDQC